MTISKPQTASKSISCTLTSELYDDKELAIFKTQETWALADFNFCGFAYFQVFYNKAYPN